MKHNLPIQSFVVRADMGCGSTIGPLTANNLGVPTVDCGIPQWAMHSIRETTACVDVINGHAMLKGFFNEEHIQTT